jgi:hypothetical protein
LLPVATRNDFTIEAREFLPKEIDGVGFDLDQGVEGFRVTTS